MSSILYLEDTIRFMSTIDGPATTALIESGEIKHIDKENEQGQISYLKIKLEEDF